MPPIAATNITVAIPPVYGTKITGPLRHVYGTLTFGDGVLTYPTGGIPLPAMGVFGMRMYLENIDIVGNNARTTDYMTLYNKTAHKLLLYEEEGVAAGGPLLECDTAEAPAARTYDFHAVGW